MSVSITDICNMALSHCGVGEAKFIADFDERSPQANACRQWYAVVVEETQRETRWTFNTKIVALALVSDPDEAYNDTWPYAYRTPSDLVFLRKIVSNVVLETTDSKISFDQTVDDTGGLILTHEPDASIEYSFLQTDPQRFPMDYAVMLSFRLAAYIAPRMTADVGKLAPLMEKMYQKSIDKARATDQNSVRPGAPPDAEFIRDR